MGNSRYGLSGPVCSVVWRFSSRHPSCEPRRNLSQMPRIRFRTPEWILFGFFFYVALLTPFFSDRPNLGNWPWLVLFAVVALCSALSALERGRWRTIAAVTRDWLPLGLTFLAFREMEFFLPRDYNIAYELAWIRWD